MNKEVEVRVIRATYVGGKQHPPGAMLALEPIAALDLVDSGRGQLADAAVLPELHAARREQVAALLRGLGPSWQDAGPTNPWRSRGR